MAQQSDRFLPRNFHHLPREERQAARAKAYADFQAWRAQRKVELIAEKAAKAATQMTCQICGRSIFAEAGVIAHHGYTRPYEGVQTRSCEGARELPFQVARDQLGDHILRVSEDIVALQAHIVAIHQEERPVQYRWTSKEYNAYTRSYAERVSPMARETFDAVKAVILAEARFRPSLYSFDDIKRDELRRLEQRLLQMERYHDEQTTRYNGWKQTHRAGAPGEAVWVPQA